MALIAEAKIFGMCASPQILLDEAHKIFLPRLAISAIIRRMALEVCVERVEVPVPVVVEFPHVARGLAQARATRTVHVDEDANSVIVRCSAVCLARLFICCLLSVVVLACVQKKRQEMHTFIHCPS